MQTRLRTKKTEAQINVKFRDWRKCPHKREIYYLRRKRNVVVEHWACLDCGFETRKRTSNVEI